MSFLANAVLNEETQASTVVFGLSDLVLAVVGSGWIGRGKEPGSILLWEGTGPTVRAILEAGRVEMCGVKFCLLN